jgi:murein L,D-transpeptidase YcbB/YkuD
VAEENAVKRLELEVRQREAETAEARARQAWWQRADPLTLAVGAAIVTLLGNMAVAVYNARAARKQEGDKSKSALQLERQKAAYTLVLQAMATNDARRAAENIEFFLASGLLDDTGDKIRAAVSRFAPVLPSAGNMQWELRFTEKFLGDLGMRPADLIEALRRSGHYQGNSTELGPELIEAVRQFQRSVGIFADGAFGPQTKAALEKAGRFPR